MEEYKNMGNEELADFFMNILKDKSLRDQEDIITILIEKIRE